MEQLLTPDLARNAMGAEPGFPPPLIQSPDVTGNNGKNRGEAGAKKLRAKFRNRPDFPRWGRRPSVPPAQTVETRPGSPNQDRRFGQLAAQLPSIRRMLDLPPPGARFAVGTIVIVTILQMDRVTTDPGLSARILGSWHETFHRDGSSPAPFPQSQWGQCRTALPVRQRNFLFQSHRQILAC